MTDNNLTPEKRRHLLLPLLGMTAMSLWLVSCVADSEKDAARPSAPEVSVSPSSPTMNTKPTWSWTGGGGGTGKFRYKLNDDNLDQGAVEISSLKYMPAQDLAHGTHTLHVQELGESGNWSESGSAAATVVTEQHLAVIGDAGPFSGHTSLYIPGDGRPVVSHYSVIPGGSYGFLKVLKCGDAECSSGNSISDPIDGPSMGAYNSIHVPPDGLPVISYREAGNRGDLKVVKCGDAACASGNTVSKVGNGGRFTSLHVPSDGLPVIAYFIEAHLWVAKCGDAACASGNTLTLVDSVPSDPGVQAGGLSLHVPADGLPVIAYHDGLSGGSRLKVAKCGDAACATGNTITTVDSTGNSGASLAVPSDGRPVIAYYDEINRRLKVLKCGNAPCTSGNVISEVDANGGSNNSIAVAEDGRPVISYSGTVNGIAGLLKIVKCGDAACASGNFFAPPVANQGTGRFTSLRIPGDGLPVISYFGGSEGLHVMKLAVPFP